MKNLMNITDLTVEEIDEILAVAEDIIANPVKYQDALNLQLVLVLVLSPQCIVWVVALSVLVIQTPPRLQREKVYPIPLKS